MMRPWLLCAIISAIAFPPHIHARAVRGRRHDTTSSEDTAPPTPAPTPAPSESPSAPPSPYPTAAPSSIPSAAPSARPSDAPSAAPSAPPSERPSEAPSAAPSLVPSALPTAWPSAIPSVEPTSCRGNKAFNFTVYVTCVGTSRTRVFSEAELALIEDAFVTCYNEEIGECNDALKRTVRTFEITDQFSKNNLGRGRRRLDTGLTGTGGGSFDCPPPCESEDAPLFEDGLRRLFARTLATATRVETLRAALEGKLQELGLCDEVGGITTTNPFKKKTESSLDH